MPGSLHAWYSLYDLEAMAEREASLSGKIEPRQLTRLRGVLHSDSGSVQASLSFSRQTSLSVSVDVNIDALLELTCQRCLEPMQHRVSEKVSLTVLEEDAPQSEFDGAREAIILEDGKLRPAAVVEDELLVSLPIIPRHETIEECGSIAQALRALAPEENSESLLSAQRDC